MMNSSFFNARKIGTMRLPSSISPMAPVRSITVRVSAQVRAKSKHFIASEPPKIEKTHVSNKFLVPFSPLSPPFRRRMRSLRLLQFLLARVRCVSGQWAAWLPAPALALPLPRPPPPPNGPQRHLEPAKYVSLSLFSLWNFLLSCESFTYFIRANRSCNKPFKKEASNEECSEPNGIIASISFQLQGSKPIAKRRKLQLTGENGKDIALSLAFVADELKGQDILVRIPGRR